MPTDLLTGRSMDSVFAEIVDVKAYEKTTRYVGECQTDSYVSAATPNAGTQDFVRVTCPKFELLARGYHGSIPPSVDELELNSDEVFSGAGVPSGALKLAMVSRHAKHDAKGNLAFDHKDPNFDGKVDFFTLPTGDAFDRAVYERIGFVPRGDASLSASSFPTLSFTDSNFDGAADVESAIGLPDVVVEWPSGLTSPDVF